MLAVFIFLGVGCGEGWVGQHLGSLKVCDCRRVAQDSGFIGLDGGSLGFFEGWFRVGLGHHGFLSF